jgi:hypothetical protein
MPVIPDTIFTKSSKKIASDTAHTDSSSAWVRLYYQSSNNILQILIYIILTQDKMDLVDQHLLYTCCPYLGTYTIWQTHLQGLLLTTFFAFSTCAYVINVKMLLSGELRSILAEAVLGKANKRGMFFLIHVV